MMEWIVQRDYIPFQGATIQESVTNHINYIIESNKSKQVDLRLQERLTTVEKSNAEMMNLIAQLTMPTPQV